VCWKSQDISCGMRKIENWLDQFGTEIALGWCNLRSGECLREGSGLGREQGNSELCWQPLSFDEVRRSNGNAFETKGWRRAN